MCALELPDIHPQTTPILDALSKYISDETIRLHMPGHKGRSFENKLCGYLGSKVFEADVTNVPGMDDLHQPHGIIKEAQKLAASTFGADYTYFLINGSSCGLQALVATVCGPEEKILVPRNIHRSILSGIILSGAIPVFFMPEYSSEYGIPMGTTPEAIRDGLNKHPDIKGVLVVNPTYQGVTSNLKGIARVVHSFGLPLLVDEAHGPHFGFHKSLPETSLEAGADAVVQGTHKMLTSFTQAAMLHLQGSRVNRRRLEAALKLLQSTSTSYLLLASLDSARYQMETRGDELVERALEISYYLRDRIKSIPGFKVLGSELLGTPGVAGLDPLKVNISVKDLGVTGLWVEKWLREKFQIQVEMADLYNVLLLITFGNDFRDIDYVIEAFRALANARLNKSPMNLKQINLIPGIPEQVITPRDAFWSEVEPVPLKKSVGRVIGEVIACYPPGIPALCPGEKITTEIIDYLLKMKDSGVRFQGCQDDALQFVNVIRKSIC